MQNIQIEEKIKESMKSAGFRSISQNLGVSKIGTPIGPSERSTTP